MDFARYVNGEWVHLDPRRQIEEGEGDDAVRHPGEILAVWPVSDLERLDIYPILPAEPMPPNKVEMGRHIEDENGLPKWVIDYTDPEVKPTCSKIEFMRRLTPTELGRLNAARKMIAAIPPEAYLNPTQIQQQLIMLEVVLQMFDLPEQIELDHTDTAQGVGALALAGILDAPAMTRVQQILTP